MKIHSIHFGNTPLFDRLKKVFVYSSEKNSPNTPLTVFDLDVDVQAEKQRGCTGHDIINALKTRYHNELIQNTPNGEFICMMDLDMAILGDLSKAEDDYDLGYTVRNQKARINSGIIFVRVSDKMKDWYRRWYETVCELLKDSKRLRQLKIKYSGINQTALGLLLEQPHDLTIKEFPASVWNCTPIHYPLLNSDTKVIHLVNNAKVLIDYERNKNSSRSKVAETWLNLERELNVSLSNP